MKYFLINFCLFFLFFLSYKPVFAEPIICGEYGQPCCQGTPNYCYNSVCGSNNMCTNESISDCGSAGKVCCPGNDCSGDGSRCDSGICVGVINNTNALDAVLPTYGKDSTFIFKDKTLGEVIAELIKYIYIFAGFALIIVLITGGFTVLTSAGSPEKSKIGYDRITQGITGFIIVFVSYMVVLLIQALFKVKIFF